MDAAGYTGNFHRDTGPGSKQIQLTTDQFLALFSKNNRLGELMTIIKSIDKDHNGYVTSTELDDILKILYPGPFDPLARSGGL